MLVLQQLSLTTWCLLAGSKFGANFPPVPAIPLSRPLLSSLLPKIHLVLKLTKRAAAMYSAHVDFAASRSHQGAQLFSPLLQATQVAWQYLDPTTRKAIRATSRSGRLLHDSSLTHLAVRLGSCRDLRRWLEEAPLGATGLKSLLWDLQVRKARVSSLHISLRGFSSRRRSILEQL